ncbi:MAG: hypothetical protein NT056_08105, partial [Proteobacteria bacterium]|nr:hypothetical protein [Pseudomonadota bacterium]
IDIFPYKPSDIIGWFILIFVGIPYWVISEFIWSYFLDKRAKKKISKSKVSFVRLLHLFIFIITYIGFNIVVIYLLKPFWENHFS